MLNSLVYSSFSLSFVVVVFFFGSGKELAVEYYFAIDFVLIFCFVLFFLNFPRCNVVAPFEFSSFSSAYFWLNYYTWKFWVGGAKNTKQ